MTPRSVLHVLNGAGGGSAVSTVALARALQEHGVSSCAVCLDAGSFEERARLIDACGGRVSFQPLYLWHRKVRSKAWKRPLLELRQLVQTRAVLGSTMKVAAFAKSHGVDLIHSSTALTLEGGYAAQRLKLGHVWHVREIVGDRHDAQAPFTFGVEGRALGAMFGAHASVVVANSAATAERLLAAGVPYEQLATVENGIELAPFRLRAAPRVASAARPLVVGMVGNCTSRWKKHALFLDAVGRLDAALDVELRVYGHAPDADPYVRDLHERAARVPQLRGGRPVRFMGFSDPAAMMDDLDVMIHPADGESFGRIVVEAWAAGVAVVGVRGGGVGAIVDDEVDGLLAPVDDAAGLARAAERLLRDVELRERLRVAGRHKAERRFSMAAHVERMLEVYARALAHPLGVTPRTAVGAQRAAQGARQ